MIQLNNVTKKFDTLEVVNNISIKINEGEIIGLLGPNGAGKTTTIRMIAGVLPPTTGKVTINDLDLFSAEELDRTKKSHIGYLPENNPIYDDMTVEEFLKMWADLKKIPLSKQMQSISKVVESIGLKEAYYRPISDLSKGYRQRTGLAQAILSEPEILLLDEPTEGLDPNQRRDIHNLIKGIGKKRTVIISSHVLSEVTKMCNRVIIINKGKVVADSSTSDLSTLSQGKQIYEIVTSGSNILSDLKSFSKNFDINKEKNGRETKWIVKTSEKKDFRGDLFKLAVSNNWHLLELTRHTEDLEDIFADLTQ